MTTEIRLVESLAPATGATVGKRWRARIIASDTWGSSAYYPRDVLERDGSRVFTAGLSMYANHPTDSETWDRPERSVHDMVGKLLSDAVFEEGEEPGLYADVEFYDSFVARINELHEDVGLSVRATGLTEDAEMDGRFGPVLVGLLAADSVDVVTRAGAGGKLTSILESDRKPAGRPINNQEGTQSVAELTKEDFEAFATELREAITGIPAALAEALKPEAPTVEKAPAGEVVVEVKAVEESKPAEVDVVAVATAVTEAQLPASAIALVSADVAKGVELAEAVKKQTDYRDQLISSSESGQVFIEESDKQGHGLARAVKVLG